MELLEDLFERELGKVSRGEDEQSAAQQGEVGERVSLCLLYTSRCV